MTAVATLALQLLATLLFMAAGASVEKGEKGAGWFLMIIGWIPALVAWAIAMGYVS